MGERKFIQTAQVAWPRWPPCPYIVKTLKNLLWSQKADDLETWYATSAARVLPGLFKWWTWLTLTYFTARQISPLLFACIWPSWPTKTQIEKYMTYCQTLQKQDSTCIRQIQLFSSCDPNTNERVCYPTWVTAFMYSYEYVRVITDETLLYETMRALP